jgi:hypothetical protein
MMRMKAGSKDALFVGFIGGMLFVLLMHYFVR